jgi:hypothetical protein
MDEYRHQALYRETQRFGQAWIVLIVGGIAAMMWFAAFQQFVIGKPFGDNPAPDIVLVITLGIFGILFPVFFFTMKLVTEVREDGIYVKFFGFHRKWHRFGFEDMERCWARTYSPLLEYGGWGIRIGKKGRAYNVSGKQGIQIVFREGKRLLIGTQNPEQFITTVYSYAQHLQGTGEPT